MRTFKVKKLKRIHGLHFAPDGKQLLAVGGEEVRMVDSAVCLDLADGETPSRIEQYANCYAVDPKMTRYVLGGANQWKGIAPIQWISPFPAGEWHWERFPEQPRYQATGMSFDPSGTRLAVAAEKQLPRRRGQTELRWSHVLNIHQFDPIVHLAVISLADAAGVIAFNSDATRLAVTGGVDGATPAVVYDITSQQLVSDPLYRFDPPATVTRCVLFLPDNRLVVANGRNVYVLPADGGEPLFTLAGHPKQVNAVALTPDGHRILTASHDGTIRTWNAETGETVKAFDWGIGSVTAVAFSPDGLTCVAAGLNGKVVVWDVDG